MSYAELYDMYLEGMNDVNEAINNIVPISEYSAIFEADDPQVQQNVENNKEASKKGQGGFMKIIMAIKKIVHNVITSIKNFFDKAKLSVQEKQAYAAFKAACAKDPNFKNKKITVKAWQEIVKKGDELYAQGEQLLRDEAANPTACEQFIQNSANFCKSAASGATAVLSVDVLMKAMVKCPQLADITLKQMNQHSSWCESLEKSMGSKEYQKFGKYAEKMRTKSRIGMWMARIGKTKYDSMHDAMMSTYNGVKQLSKFNLTDKDSIHLMRTMANNKTTKDVIAHTTKSVGKQVAKDKMDAIKRFPTSEGKYRRALNKANNMTRKDGESEEAYAARVQQQRDKADKIADKAMKDRMKKNAKKNGPYKTFSQMVFDR